MKDKKNNLELQGKSSPRRRGSRERLVEVGRVRKAFGVKGQLSVEWNDDGCPTESKRIFVGTEDGDSLTEYKVEIDHKHSHGHIVTLEGLRDRTIAESLRGSLIFADKSELPDLEDGEFYTYQLIEMRVETTEGEYLGEIKEIFPTGSNDVYVVRDGKKEILIPATEEVISEIDLEKKLVKVELLEGLR